MAAYGKRGGSNRLMSQINVVPYIDVMLVLLVIFMVTAPLISTSYVDLPQISKSNAPPAVPIEVVIKADGKLYMRDKDKGAEKPITLDGLLASIKEKQTRNPDQPVVIAADQSVLYGKVLEVMDALQRNHVKKVGLLAKPRPS
ncbi:MAG: protein TolR [Betaproteobacteria bacterium]|nr:protein TolR [Betaproteobacteria bacterium]